MTRLIRLLISLGWIGTGVAFAQTDYQNFNSDGTPRISSVLNEGVEGVGVTAVNGFTNIYGYSGVSIVSPTGKIQTNANTYQYQTAGVTNIGSLSLQENSVGLGVNNNGYSQIGDNALLDLIGYYHVVAGGNMSVSIGGDMGVTAVNINAIATSLINLSVDEAGLFVASVDAGIFNYNGELSIYHDHFGIGLDGILATLPIDMASNYIKDLSAINTSGNLGVTVSGVYSMASTNLLAGLDGSTQSYLKAGAGSSNGELKILSADGGSGLYAIGSGSGDSEFQLFSTNVFVNALPDGTFNISGSGGVPFNISGFNAVDFGSMPLTSVSSVNGVIIDMDGTPNAFIKPTSISAGGAIYIQSYNGAGGIYFDDAIQTSVWGNGGNIRLNLNLDGTGNLDGGSLGKPFSFTNWTNIDAGGTTIINIADPTNPQDAATKAYVDSAEFDTGSLWEEADGNIEMTSPATIIMNDKPIKELAAGVTLTDAVNLGQMQTAIADAVLSGVVTMTGGSVVVTDGAITTSSVLVPSPDSIGTNIGWLAVAYGSGSATITSTNILEAGPIRYILKP